MIQKTDDNGASDPKISEDSNSIAIVAERTWTVPLQAKDGLSELPKSFKFGIAKADADLTYQRYHDADVVKVSREIDLERQYGEVKWGWTAWALGIAIGFLALGLAVAAFWVSSRQRGPAQ